MKRSVGCMKNLLTLVSVSILALFSVTAAHAGDISHDDLKDAIESGDVFLIDVNGSKSFKKGHIPGAVDFASVKEEIASLLPEDKDALVVAYCGGPSCRAYKRATNAVSALGYKNVLHYSGGLSGWKSSGEELEKSDA